MVDTKSPTWKLFREWFDDTFDTDSRIPRTILPFLFRPGFLVGEYLAGKRERYTTPLRVYVFSALVAFFVFAWVADRAEATFDVAASPDTPSLMTPPAPGMRITIDRPPDEARGWLDDQIRASTDRLQSLPQDQAADLVLGAFFDAAPKVLSLLLPVFAGFLKLLWPRRTFFEHAIFSLNLHALVLIVLAACSLSPNWFVFAGFIFVQAHLLLGLRRVYGGPRWGTALRYLSLCVLYGMVLLGAAVFTLLVAVLET